MLDQSATPLLDRVQVPADMKDFDRRELRQLADELRQELIGTVSQTGGHLGAGLGEPKRQPGAVRRHGPE